MGRSRGRREGGGLCSGLHLSTEAFCPPAAAGTPGRHMGVDSFLGSSPSFGSLGIAWLRVLGGRELAR